MAGATVIAKRARIPATVKRSREKADDKLRSLHVEAAFLRECCPRLADAGAATPTLLHCLPSPGTHAAAMVPPARQTDKPNKPPTPNID